MKKLILAALAAFFTSAQAAPLSFYSGTCVDDGAIGTDESFCAISTAGYSSVSVFFTVATAALTGLKVQISNDGTNWATIASASADFTNPQGHVFGTSGDLTTAGTSGQHFIILNNLDGVTNVRLLGTSAGTANPTATFKAQ